MRTSTFVLVVLLSMLIAMPRIQAQASHTAGQSAIDAALQQHVSTAAADRADLLRVLGCRMRGGCGAEVVLETVNATRAFLTIDSGFPLAGSSRSRFPMTSAAAR